MDKVLITVYVLAIEKEYDLLVPINLKTADVIKYIQESVKELSHDVYEINNNCLLYDANGQVINFNNIIKYSGITNGCKVILK